MDVKNSWIPDGLVTGLIGYLTVVVFFAVVNLLSGQGAFQTAAVLGSALFFGSGGSGTVVPGPGPIIAYNGVHILASLLIGLGAAWLVYQTERHKPLWFVIFFVFLAGFIYSVTAMGVLAAEMAHLLSWPLILLANLLAGVTGGGYLWWRHIRLPGELAKMQSAQGG